MKTEAEKRGLFRILNNRPWRSLWLVACWFLLLCLPVFGARDGNSDEREEVVIAGHRYQVPANWQGRSFATRSLSSPPLVQVPPELVWNGGSIYLLPSARDALIAMAEVAATEGIRLRIDSGYRSVWYQGIIYQRLLARGKTFAEIARSVAPPGYSEHVLGLAVDFVPSDWRFAGTPAYSWLKKNAARFGFRETYPENRANGMPWEPSHWRYLAKKTGDQASAPSKPMSAGK